MLFFKITFSPHIPTCRLQTLILNDNKLESIVLERVPISSGGGTALSLFLAIRNFDRSFLCPYLLYSI